MKRIGILAVLMAMTSAAMGQPLADVTITILADEITVNSSLKPDLGFSCIVETNGGSLLFDTSSDGPLLLANAESLRKDLSGLRAVFISHPHTDHTGGLSYLLPSRVSGIPVYVGKKYFNAFAGLLTSWKCTPVAVTDTARILPGIYSSGELPGSTYEQSLVIDTEKGLIVLVGCSHPGIARIVAYIRDRFRKDVYMVLGGMHLLDEPDTAVVQIARQLKSLRVRKCAPAHCTGSTAVTILRREFGADFVPVGAGSAIRP